MPGLKREAPGSTAGNSQSTKRQRSNSRPEANGKGSYSKPSSDSNGSAGRKPIAADAIKGAKNSAEAHQIQRQLAKERKLAKPNAEPTLRAKKLWERLRLKSHVPVAERRTLVTELFEIVTGRVKDFVFKHDSVRVIQCALKYANAAQAKEIARELRGSYRELAESKYAKFLVGKILVVGDEEVRSWVVGEMQGWVKKGINHPEAGWVLDDMYRGICSKQQKATLLREWYGPEFVIFADKLPTALQKTAKTKTKKAETTTEEDPASTSDLVTILENNPEKRKPTLEHLHQMITALLNKKMTGFTMLHDAMLQYSLAIGPPSSSTQATEFLELLKDEDQEGDLVKNLAFTASGARILARALAYGTAKDRKNLLKFYKDTVETMAYDPHGAAVLLAAMECVDDTVMLSKLIHAELLHAKLTDANERLDKLADLALHIDARTPLMLPLSGPAARWLFRAGGEHAQILDEVAALRPLTSKKDPAARRSELARAALAVGDHALLSLVAERADTLVQASFGCQFVAELLLGARAVLDPGDAPADKALDGAMRAVAALAQGDPADESHISHSPAAGRMLKTLASGKRFDADAKELVAVEPRLGFADVLYEVIREHVVAWACGDSSFVVENMLGDEGFKARAEFKKTIKKNKSELEKASKEGNKGAAAVLERLYVSQRMDFM